MSDETGEASETQGEGGSSAQTEEALATTGCSLEQVWTGRGPSEFSKDGALANGWQFALDEDGGFSVIAYDIVGGQEVFFLTSFDADLNQQWQREADGNFLDLVRLPEGRLAIVGGSTTPDGSSQSAHVEWFDTRGEHLGNAWTKGVWTQGYSSPSGELLLAGYRSLAWSDPTGYLWGVDPGTMDVDVSSAGWDTLRFIDAIHAEASRVWVAGIDEQEQEKAGWLAELDAQGEVVWEVADAQLGPRFDQLAAHEQGLLVVSRTQPHNPSQSRLAVYSTQGERLEQPGEGVVLPHIKDLERLPTGGYIASTGRELLRLSPQLELEHSCQLDNQAWAGSFGALELAGEQLFVALDGDPIAPGMPELRALMRVEGMLD